MKLRLKSCVCGYPNPNVEINTHNGWFIRCPNCNMQSTPTDSRQRAIRSWNETHDIIHEASEVLNEQNRFN